MSQPGSIITILALGLFVTGTLTLGGCREEEDETLPAASTSQNKETGNSGRNEWLEVTNTETPLDFIARVTGAPAAQITPRLDRATALYQESPRMIANRSVQLWQEIREKQEEIDIIDLLDDLAPENGSARTGSLTAVVQNYRVLRSQGADHTAAITTATQAAQ
ncbi:hypothetical protein Q0601_07790 [Paracoccus onubensis]|uniref:hypothetical protein n=1 Tax=Paracoccus onubensis TaxID=1675788 RepID=UPI00273077CA|nr:hypothetical protein [Paracoccus onubensis]MDP0927066.1 hypothetical protein [Paracoccus onubensis]